MQEAEEAVHVRRFWWLTILLAIMAISVRCVLIVLYPDGRDDLGIYFYYAGLINRGLNPYIEVANAPVGIQHANHTFITLTLFANVMRLWNSPTALRMLFALVDGLVVLTIGYLVHRPMRWRRSVMIFYSLNPFVLMSMVVFSVDKGIILWLLLLAIIAIEAQNPLASISATVANTLYRWIGAFFVLPVALYFARSWRGFIGTLFLSGAAFALVHVPYWPANLWVYYSRAARTAMPPIHDSPTMLLSTLGLYHSQMVTIGMVATVVILYALFVFRRVSLVEVVVLSTFFTNMIVPDLPANRIVLVSVALFWLISLNQQRVLAIWVVTVLAAPFANPYETAAIMSALHIPIHIPFPSIPHMLLMNLLPALLLVYYFIDKSRGLVARDTLLPQGWLLESLWSKHLPHSEAPAEPVK